MVCEHNPRTVDSVTLTLSVHERDMLIVWLKCVLGFWCEVPPTYYFTAVGIQSNEEVTRHTETRLTFLEQAKPQRKGLLRRKESYRVSFAGIVFATVFGHVVAGRIATREDSREGWALGLIEDRMVSCAFEQCRHHHTVNYERPCGGLVD